MERSHPGFLVVGVALMVACHGPTITTTDDSSSTTSADSGDTTTDTGSGLCEGAALEYGGVCFYAHSVEAMGFEHPLDLDGQPGDELVGVDDGVVSVHKWNGNGFTLVGEAALPGEVGSSSNAGVVAGEFDDEPGLDLIVAERGEWAALYHLDGAGLPTLVGPTEFLPARPALSQAFQNPVAVGPDDSGRWRVVAHYDNGEEYVGSQPLGLWEVEGTDVVGERLDLPTEACSLQGCSGGDFNADDRQDAICTIQHVCPNDPPDEDIVHVVLLAQADGSLVTMAYPTTIGGTAEPRDLDADGDLDMIGKWGSNRLWYRLGEGSGLGGGELLDLPEPPASAWNLVSVGDLDQDADDDLVLGDLRTVLVFENVLGAPELYEVLEASGGELEFPAGASTPFDVNADGIVDLPMHPSTMLVSEVQP